MKRKCKVSIVFNMILILSYLAFILCWIYIFRTRGRLSGQMITLQEAEKMKQFSTMTAIIETVNYLFFLVFIRYEWVLGNRKIKFLIKKGVFALLIMALSGVIMTTGYKILAPSAEILMNFFEPLFGCAELLILSLVIIGISKLLRH